MNNNDIDGSPKRGCVGGGLTGGQGFAAGCAVFLWTLVLVPIAIIVVGGFTESIELGFIAAFIVVMASFFLYRAIGKRIKK